ncbi:hypothetical protein BKA61DRAFT_618315 [Leptodontidium sp. MPI-SDFR-AT-0119]|nr:hypothetical protein BKA61DRAFT_618315 [Leptodontidium sp. MPI-SDFR-AT-0119]
MVQQKLKVSCAGLGRMGKRHALNFLDRTPRADLVAASTPDDIEYQWGKMNLEPHGVTMYHSYEDMLKHPGLQAVVIASVTAVHAMQAVKAINADKHVLCEKPLSISAEASRTVVTAASKKPHLKIMCGFSRRFDDSYRDAWNKMDQGMIGRPSVFRSQTCDMWDSTGFFVAYAEFSGGIFVDCSIHDIDLALWFFGEDSVVKSVVASGIVALEPALRKFNDCDNAIGIIEFYGGKIAYLYCSRIMAAGQEDTSELIGTQGKLTINAQPMSNLVNIHEAQGIRREIPSTYYGRFEKAFLTEANEFTRACLDDTRLPFKLGGATKTVEIACALQESLVSGQKIWFDETGSRAEKASL